MPPVPHTSNIGTPDLLFYKEVLENEFFPESLLLTCLTIIISRINTSTMVRWSNERFHWNRVSQWTIMHVWNVWESMEIRRSWFVDKNLNWIADGIRYKRETERKLLWIERERGKRERDWGKKKTERWKQRIIQIEIKNDLWNERRGINWLNGCDTRKTSSKFFMPYKTYFSLRNCPVSVPSIGLRPLQVLKRS